MPRPAIMTPKQNETLNAVLRRMRSSGDTVHDGADRFLASFVLDRMANLPTMDEERTAACAAAVVQHALTSMTKAMASLRQDVRGIVS